MAHTRFRLSPLASALAHRPRPAPLPRPPRESASTQQHRGLLPLGAAMLAGVTLMPAQSFAQDAPDQSLAQVQNVETLPEVKVQATVKRDDYQAGRATIGAGVPTPLSDIPQSVTVINSALMQAQGATSLGDALRNVPVITVSRARKSASARWGRTPPRTWPGNSIPAQPRSDSAFPQVHAVRITSICAK